MYDYQIIFWRVTQKKEMTSVPYIPYNSSTLSGLSQSGTTQNYVTKDSLKTVLSSYAQLGGNASFQSETISGSDTIGTLSVTGALSTSTLTCSNSATIGSSNSNHVISGNTSFASLPTCTATPTSSTQLVTKSYCDTAAGNYTNLLTQANTWTQAQTFSAQPVITATAPAASDNSTKAATTAFTQSAITANNTALLTQANTWTQAQTFSAQPVITATAPSASDNSTKAATTAFTQSAITASNTALKSAAGTWSGVQTFSAQPVITATMPSASDNSTNVATTQFVQAAIVSQLPVLSPMSDTVTFGVCTTFAFNSGSNMYVLTNPYLGGSTTTNSNQYTSSFYINFPALSFTTSLYDNTVCLQFTYMYRGQGVCPVPASTLNNTASYNSSFNYSSISALTGMANTVVITATIFIANRAGGLLVNAPMQSTSIWTNPTTSSSTQGAIKLNQSFKVGLSGTNQTASYYPFNATYISDTKCRIDVGFPSMRNNPIDAGSVSCIAYSAQLTTSVPLTNSTIPNGPILQPSLSSYSAAGGAYLSLS